jgi:hypothetical protein
VSTRSDILQLILNASDGSDPFLLSDFLTNWGILDSSPGVFICTSSTHPSWGTDQAGRLVFETDTLDFLGWNGTTFLNLNLTVNNLTVVNEIAVNNLLTEGVITVNNLPISDPHVVGQMWNHSGVATISAG